MSSARSFRLLSLLLIASLGINLWQDFRAHPLDEETGQKPVATFFTRIQPDTGRLPGKKTVAEPADEPDADTSAKSAAAKPSPEQQSEDELIFGASGIDVMTPMHGEPSGKVSPQRLKELAAMPVSRAERFQVQARLFLPGDRVADLGTVDLAAGQRIRFERIREFPFPTSFSLATTDPVPGTSFPVTPTTPGDFEFKNRGIEVELDVTPAPGTLVLGGSVRQTVFEGFNRMPGEIFSPMLEGDIVLTDNKVLQPQFTTREAPFVAAAAEGQPIRIPVLTSFGQTFLELTCTPAE